MFLASNQALTAGMMSDALDIEFKVVNLYTQNLNALGTQAALVAGLAFLAITNAYIPATIHSSLLAHIYYSGYAISFIASLAMICRAIIAAALGPIKAMLGIYNYIKYS